MYIPGLRHGLSGHPLYRTWASMLQRCENPRDSRYPDYGGRGIKVCAEWHDPRAFIAWIEENIGPRPGGRTAGGRPAYTLNRADNDGHYEPDNVRVGRLETTDAEPAIVAQGTSALLDTHRSAAGCLAAEVGRHRRRCRRDSAPHRASPELTSTPEPGRTRLLIMGDWDPLEHRRARRTQAPVSGLADPGGSARESLDDVHDPARPARAAD